RGHLPLPLQLLFLPPRQLAQLLGELIHPLVRALLPRAAGRLVPSRHLVHFALEQVGEILGDRSRAAATTATAAVAIHLHLQLVFLFGLLQILERLVLRRERAVRALRLELALGGL